MVDSWECLSRVQISTVVLADSRGSSGPESRRSCSELRGPRNSVANAGVGPAPNTELCGFPIWEPHPLGSRLRGNDGCTADFPSGKPTPWVPACAGTTVVQQISHLGTPPPGFPPVRERRLYKGPLGGDDKTEQLRHGLIGQSGAADWFRGRDGAPCREWIGPGSSLVTRPSYSG